MPREKSGYRANLELLNKRFPDKEALNATEVAAFLGRSRQTVKKHIPFNSMGLITKADLARVVCV